MTRTAESSARARVSRAFFAACVAAGICAMDAAQAQTTTTTKSNPAKPWTFGCRESPDKKSKQCSIVQNFTVTRGEKKARLLTVAVQPQPNAKNHALVLLLPHGVFLPNGVELKVDDKKPIKIPVQTSNPKGVLAGGEISDDLLTAMKKGNKMNVSFMFVTRKPVTVPVSLAGFTASYKKLTAK